MRAVIKIELQLSGSWGPSQYGGGIWLYLPGRMLRVWASVDDWHGSHWGLWRTRLPADGLDGWNWRGGPDSWPLTVLAHTRKISP